jgi:glycosyltransferase involved in cell wall biosynthesis
MPAAAVESLPPASGVANERTTRPDRRPRIAIVCRILWNGGVQRVAIAQTEALTNLGYECQLIFLRKTPDATYRTPSGTRILEPEDKIRGRRTEGIWAWITYIYAGHRGREATVDVDLLWKLRRELGGFDAVVFSDQFAAATGIYLNLIRRIPYILVFHEFYPKVRRPRFSKILFALADAFDAVSILLAPAIVTTSSKNLHRLRDFRTERVYLARIGCPPPIAGLNREISETRFRVLSLSVWEEGRHPEVYLEVARRNPGYEFTLAGSWADSARMEEFRRLCSDTPNFHVTGVITEEQRIRLLNDCLIYMRFGFGEAGPGMGGLEALTFGNIVIANRGLGISEVITDGVDGRMTAGPIVESTTAILESIRRSSDEDLRTMSAAARNLAGRLSWESHAVVLSQALADIGVQRSMNRTPKSRSPTHE